VERAQTSVLYADSRRLPFAARLSWAARIRIYELFMAACAPPPDASILDVGVTSDVRSRESNFLERLYPHKDRITCVGTEDGSHLERNYPGVRFIPVGRDVHWPFADLEFDIAFSNAAIEHVGDRTRQAAFVAEMLRVAGRVFVVTPNRWFPVEAHTGLPLVHYLPAPAFRTVLRRTRYKFWTEEDHLNLLTGDELRRLFPAAVHAKVAFTGIGLGRIKSNVAAFAASDRRRY
jgi:SAM-dependent methyltransferase